MIASASPTILTNEIRWHAPCRRTGTPAGQNDLRALRAFNQEAFVPDLPTIADVT